MRRMSSLLLAGVLVVLFAFPAGASKPVKVITDPSGDAGAQGTAIPGFPQAGFDILEGYIARSGTNLEFSVKHAAMPPNGTLPEAFRFLWNFTVGKTDYRLTVKSADIGKPDIPGMSGNERIGRVDLMGHFRLEGNCVSVPMGINFINCQPLAYLEGSFDAASATFTVIVPLKSIKAKTGSLITGGGGTGAMICSICWVTHIAERSLNTVIIDDAVQLVTYKVPKK